MQADIEKFMSKCGELYLQQFKDATGENWTYAIDWASLEKIDRSNKVQLAFESYLRGLASAVSYEAGKDQGMAKGLLAACPARKVGLTVTWEKPEKPSVYSWYEVDESSVRVIVWGEKYGINAGSPSNNIKTALASSPAAAVVLMQADIDKFMAKCGDSYLEQFKEATGENWSYNIDWASLAKIDRSNKIQLAFESYISGLANAVKYEAGKDDGIRKALPAACPAKKVGMTVTWEKPEKPSVYSWYEVD